MRCTWPVHWHRSRVWFWCFEPLVRSKSIKPTSPRLVNSHRNSTLDPGALGPGVSSVRREGENKLSLRVFHAQKIRDFLSPASAKNSVTGLNFLNADAGSRNLPLRFDSTHLAGAVRANSPQLRWRELARSSCDLVRVNSFFSPSLPFHPI